MRFGLAAIFALVLAGSNPCSETRAGTFVFDTYSTADQMISSPLLGTFALDASGPQTFTIDTTNGTADVASMFQGNDLPDPFLPGTFDSYSLYNTVTTGVVTMNPSGSYHITFSLLFELDVTSGALTGLSLVTEQNATFAAADVSTIPFSVGTAFFDPSGSDAVGVYLKNDFGPYEAGTLVGESYDRVVTVVPEPSALMLTSVALVACLGGVYRYRRGS